MSCARLRLALLGPPLPVMLRHSPAHTACPPLLACMHDGFLRSLAALLARLRSHARSFSASNQGYFGSVRSEEQLEPEDESEPEFDSIEDAFEYFCNIDRQDRQKAQTISQQHSLDKFEYQPVLEPDQARSLLSPEEPRPVAAQEEKCSREEIAQNAKKWMIGEDLDYEFDELHNQCFSVENYHKIFHHFNFTIKMKKPRSNDWTLALYFAEVKEIFSHKIYFCSALEPYENGHCYACKNQGIDDLKHPIIGAFERGSPDSVSSFMYDSDSDDGNYDFI
ncbi:hypothetical protein PR202_gb29720 [Eleusine coracana subsp. coracana]|uniref:DUF3615 domain-containing protein n=1 Tax=Eleusine coracana subsp. coracana TaxID=191504 RepID=A0AAV5FXR4_ELECO|nr:hypothetical protein PR202_gb29720 [Eleusine coracana subsp. coracana]